MLHNLKQHSHWIITAGILGILIVVAALVLANSNIYLKNIGTSTLQNNAIINSVAVSGQGKVFGTPDMVTLSVTISETRDTSGAALSAVNTKIDQILGAVSAANILREDVSTSGLSVYPEYDYSGNSRRLLGQRATQSLQIKVKGVDSKATKATQLIDSLSAISNIELGGISFDIEDKAALLNKARELAMANAKDKATALAGYAGVRLLSPISISESTSGGVTPPMYNERLAAADSAGTSTQLPTGQLELTVDVSVLWGIE